MNHQQLTFMSQKGYKQNKTKQNKTIYFEFIQLLEHIKD